MHAPSRKRALLVDDHHIVTDALRTSVPALGLFDEIETASSLAEAQTRLEANPNFKLAILDLHLADASGRGTLEGIRERYPDIPVLVFSGDANLENITMAFECGARGYVTKTSPVNVVDQAIRIVLAGGLYIPPDAAQILGLPQASPPPAAMAPASALRLSGRQQDVFKLLLQGMPNKVIAWKLGIAEGTAKAHLNTVYRTLGVRTRVEAILRAKQLGLV